MSIRAVNNFNTTLASGITNVATSMTMAAGAGNSLRTKLTGSPSSPMAVGDYLYVTITDTIGNIEIVKITALVSSGDSCTIARGQDGTTARAWSAGALVDARPCAAFFADALLLLGTTAAAVSYAGSANVAGATVEAALDDVSTTIGEFDAVIAALGTASTKAFINDDSMASASDVNIPSADSVKTYIAAQIAANATPPASETVQGKVELATVAEAVAGTDTARAVTAAGVAAALAASPQLWELVENRAMTATQYQIFDLQEDVYCAWKFIINGVVPANDGEKLLMRPGYSAGTVFAGDATCSSALTVATVTAMPAWAICGSTDTADGVGTAASEYATATVDINGVGSTASTSAIGFHYSYVSSWINVTSDAQHAAGLGLYNDVRRTFDSVRFGWTAGNFEAVGTITMYGLRRP